jgi:hypothetical protein
MTLSEEEKQKSIEDSKQKYWEQRDKVLKRKTLLAAGRKTFRDKNLFLIKGKLGTYTIAMAIAPAIGFRTSTKSRYNIAFSLCSPKDTFSKRVARGYLGARITGLPPTPFHFALYLDDTNPVSYRTAFARALLHLKQSIVESNPKSLKIPNSIRKTILEENQPVPLIHKHYRRKLNELSIYGMTLQAAEEKRLESHRAHLDYTTRTSDEPIPRKDK